MLVGHLGEAHRWAAHAVREGNPHAPEPDPPLTDRVGLSAWYAESAALLVATLREVGPDTRAGPSDRGRVQQDSGRAARRTKPPCTAGTWRRPQVRRPGYPEPLALDAVDEVATMFFPRQVRLGRIPPLTAALAVAVDDQEWVLAGDGIAPPERTPDATVRGPADVLALLLWGRVGLDDQRVTLTGDRSAAAAVLSAGIVP